MKKAIIVSFEGIDGCGKSTQAKNFVRYLRARKHRVLFLKEPGTTQLGNELRKILLARQDRISDLSELLLYLSARNQLCREILDRNAKIRQIIVLDRFLDSTVAYQGYGRGLPLDFIEQSHRLILGNLVPDITFLIDADAAALRVQLRSKGVDRLERSLKFQQKVRSGYLALAKQEPSRFRVIRRSSKEATSAQIIAAWSRHGQACGTKTLRFGKTRRSKSADVRDDSTDAPDGVSPINSGGHPETQTSSAAADRPAKAGGNGFY